MFEMSYNELEERLRRLDEDAYLTYGVGERLHLVIVGGSALILGSYIDKATHDLDALSASSALSMLLEKYDINSRVQTYINNFPYNYEDRLVLFLKGRAIDFFTASLEDIVVAKLYSMRPVDKSDIEANEVVNNINWSLLEKLVFDEDEAKASALNDKNYMDLVANYKEYARKHKP